MDNFKKHPISIIKVFPAELSIKAYADPNNREKYGTIPYSMSVGHSDYDNVGKVIVVGVRLETEKKKESETTTLPFYLVVDMVAEFRVDEKEFPIEHIVDWATRNAPLIIYPYLREHVFALTVRAGFMPMLLPLIEVPTFRLENRSMTVSPKVS